MFSVLKSPVRHQSRPQTPTRTHHFLEACWNEVRGQRWEVIRHSDTLIPPPPPRFLLLSICPSTQIKQYHKILSSVCLCLWHTCDLECVFVASCRVCVHFLSFILYYVIKYEMCHILKLVSATEKKNIILTFYLTILKKKKGHNCEEKRLQFSIVTWQDVFEKTHKHASVRLAVVCVCVCVCIAAAAQNQTTRIIYMLRPYANEARGELITAADLSSVLIYESHSLRWVSVQIHSSSVFCWSDLIWSWSQSINGLIYEWAAAHFWDVSEVMGVVGSEVTVKALCYCLSVQPVSEMKRIFGSELFSICITGSPSLVMFPSKVENLTYAKKLEYCIKNLRIKHNSRV